ncbi:MAG: reverse transcriptase domain-containing protein, partial [Clostridium sp.]|uniref:reverse transcriptase domain-containing protein n=1 Tax=Clostridium sp. TaxID=1506 RepID=UPI003F352F89
QGFKNSPGLFQMIMDRVLKDHIDKKCCVYLDDILVFGETEQEHDFNLEAVLKALSANKFKLNERKIQYKQKKIKLLGMFIDGIRKFPIEQHLKKILDFKIPKSRKELQRVLGFCNYYRKYIKNLSSIAAPLYNQLKGKSSEIEWDKKCNEAFIELKNKIN